MRIKEHKVTDSTWEFEQGKGMWALILREIDQAEKEGKPFLGRWYNMCRGK